MTRVVSVLLALLLVSSTAIAPAAGAVDIQESSEIFGESVTSDMGVLGWSPSEDVVRYGSDRNPGWIVHYEDGHGADLEAWANGSTSREIRSHDNASNVMLISAPASDVGLKLLSFSGEHLRDLSYVETIGVNRRVSVDPILPTELKSSDAWSPPAGATLATAGGVYGSFDADGAAWSSEVNTSTMTEVRTTVGADQVAVDGTGVRVAVLDTGLDYDSDLYGTRVPTGKNTISNTTLNVTDLPNATAEDYAAVADGSDSNHGSWVATAIAGNGTGPNATGIAPNATLIPVKVLSDDGSGSTEDIAEGLEYACGEANADVVSMSLGAPFRSERLEGEIQECLENESVSAVVVAAGNSRLTYRYVASPGDADGVVTVAATDARHLNESESAYFSNVGPDPETSKNPTVGAPGMEITAEVADGNVTLSGTSMATPVVSGVAALTLDKHGDLQGQPKELRTQLSETAEPLPSAGTTEVGAGRISAVNAVDDADGNQSQQDARSVTAESRDSGNKALAGSFWRELLG
jgi:subtilisin family serine protease